MILPLVFGCLSGLLMIWDLRNYRVIVSMGMAWDTGPPFWPYQGSWIAFLTLNAPAQVLSWPLFLLFDLRTASERYPLLFPVSLAWWWWLGRRIDRGLLPSRPLRRRWLTGAGLSSGALALYLAFGVMLLDDPRWWSQYHSVRVLLTLGPGLWCLLIAVALTLAAIRVFRPVPRPPD